VGRSLKWGAKKKCGLSKQKGDPNGDEDGRVAAVLAKLNAVDRETTL
jgi:hypothetical protein